MARFVVLLLALIAAAFVPATVGAVTAPVVYVAGDGSGDFNVDGKADDVEINKALQYVQENKGFTTVYLKGPFSYDIAASVVVGSNTTLTGDSTAVLLASADMDIVVGAPGATDITIRGFKIDGNTRGGVGINLTPAWKNASISDMNIDNIGNANVRKYGILLNPPAFSEEMANVKIYNNAFTMCTFDSIDMGNLNGVEIYGNNILGGTTAYPIGIRIYQINNLKIYNNVIKLQKAGYAGIQIYNGLVNNVVMDKVEIFNNEFIDIRSAGILAFSGRSDGKLDVNDKHFSQNMHIHHNIFRNCGTHPTTASAGGIMISGFDATLIENNIFDACKGVAIGAFQSNNYAAPLQTEPYVTYVRNNIIVNTIAHPGSGQGHAVSNRIGDSHTFVIDNNIVYNNAADNYLNITPNSSIEADPLFADAAGFDYHLKSTTGRWDGSTWVKDTVDSPGIDAGFPGSAFSNEPAPNGGVINIGLYGNTDQASKSVK